MAKDRELPPPLEMACLNALWELGEGNVEEVRVSVSRARPLAYTTVLTLLDRLSRRGAVSRRKEGRGFRYQPSIDRDKLRRLALGRFLDHHFGGSVESLQSFLELEPPAFQSSVLQSPAMESSSMEPFESAFSEPVAREPEIAEAHKQAMEAIAVAPSEANGPAT